MADVPFFRGVNRMDWLYAVMLQTAVDWGSSDTVARVADVLGYVGQKRYTPPFGIIPPVVIVDTDAFRFVVSASTKTNIQWIGNVLGSGAIPVPPSHGTVSAYFGLSAQAQYAATVSDLLTGLGSKKIVLVGFSLGGATMTVYKDMLKRQAGADAACVVFGNPRAGTLSFSSGYPTDNYQGFGVVNDPVPSVPPSVWAGTGARNDWTPFPPLVEYTHADAGFTLDLGGAIRGGYTTQTVDEVILGFDTGLWLQFHSQPLYGRLLRVGLPDTLPAGYQGYPGADRLDAIAPDVFFSSSVPWRWAPAASPTTGDAEMTIQLSIGIRNKTSPSLGFQEIYYFPGTTPDSVFNAALPGGSNYVGLRANFLSADAEIYFVRASAVHDANAAPVAKRSYLRKMITPIGGLLGQMETIQAAVVYFGYTAGRTAKRQFHFRGIPESWVIGEALSAAGVAGQYLITSGAGGGFLDVLKSGGLVLNIGNTTEAFDAKIQSASKPTSNSLITLTLDTAVTYAPNTLVEIRSCKSAPLLNGRWQAVGAATAGTITLSGSERYGVPPVLTGKIRALTPTTFNANAFEFSGVGSKKTGRPPYLQRGRRSPQLRHR